MNSETRNCQNCKKDFTIEVDDFSFYKKMKVPAPQICSDCRFKLRAMWRNETTLYTGQKCGLCNKSIITNYNPKLNYKIYCYNCFYSDKWDAKDYSLEYSKNKTFFEQFNNLLILVPKIATYLSFGSGANINSEYTNMASGCKDCHLIFNAGPAEDTMYSRGVKDIKQSLDIYFGINLEGCYGSININRSYNLFFSQNSSSCVDSMFLLNCSGLTNCFGCVNLRNKSYCWFNDQLTHKEYIKKLTEVIGSYSKLEEQKRKFAEFCLQFPHRENNNLKILNSTGDYLLECKDVKNSFEVSKSENSSYIFSSKEIRDSLGTIGYGHKAEQVLESVAIGFSSHIIGSFGIEHSQNIQYSFYSTKTTDCIGCDGLKNAQYCILNKQYGKEEYEELKNHIVKELTEKGIYGLMMPPEIAPFAYNETIAQDNMPLTKEEAIAEGFRWEDDIQMTKGKETLQPEEIPDHINNIKDEITKEILRCIECERNYKITEQELLFYRKMKLPIPRKCFYCRHQDRIKRRGPYKFWDRKCDHCSKDIKTNYSPDRLEIVYCEKCYQQEVY